MYQLKHLNKDTLLRYSKALEEVQQFNWGSPNWFTNTNFKLPFEVSNQVSCVSASHIYLDYGDENLHDNLRILYTSYNEMLKRLDSRQIAQYHNYSKQFLFKLLLTHTSFDTKLFLLRECMYLHSIVCNCELNGKYDELILSQLNIISTAVDSIGKVGSSKFLYEMFNNDSCSFNRKGYQQLWNNLSVVDYIEEYFKDLYFEFIKVFAQSTSTILSELKSRLYNVLNEVLTLLHIVTMIYEPVEIQTRYLNILARLSELYTELDSRAINRINVDKCKTSIIMCISGNSYYTDNCNYSESTINSIINDVKDIEYYYDIDVTNTPSYKEFFSDKVSTMLPYISKKEEKFYRLQAYVERLLVIMIESLTDCVSNIGPILFCYGHVYSYDKILIDRLVNYIKLADKLLKKSYKLQISLLKNTYGNELPFCNELNNCKETYYIIHNIITLLRNTTNKLENGISYYNIEDKLISRIYTLLDDHDNLYDSCSFYDDDF